MRCLTLTLLAVQLPAKHAPSKMHVACQASGVSQALCNNCGECRPSNNRPWHQNQDAITAAVRAIVSSEGLRSVANAVTESRGLLLWDKTGVYSAGSV